MIKTKLNKPPFPIGTKLECVSTKFVDYKSHDIKKRINLKKKGMQVEIISLDTIEFPLDTSYFSFIGRTMRPDESYYIVEHSKGRLPFLVGITKEELSEWEILK